MRFRGKSVRRKITALLLVPLTSLVALWAFSVAITAQEARELLAVSAVSDSLGRPAEAAVQALQQERRQTMVYLADPRNQADLRRARTATDGAVSRLTAAADTGARADLNEGAQQRLDSLLNGLDRLDQIRGNVDANTTTRTSALEAYNGMAEPGVRFLSALHLLENVALDRHGRAVSGLGHAAESLSRTDALIAGALVAGRVTETEQRRLTEGAAERRQAFATYLPDLPLEDRQLHDYFWQVGLGHTLTVTEENLVAHGEDSIGPERWEDVTSAAATELRSLADAAADRYQDEVSPAATAVLTRAAVAGVAGLAAVLVSVFVSIRVGRGLVRDLRALRREAHEAADVRLPAVMRRLGEGETVDVQTEVPRLEYGRDEVGDVGRALNTLQRAAVEATVRQADMRRGVSDVFVNLARRNQVLLHRQLSLLDTMERRTDDADELADLFRLDHLTTRMRRHAEGLVILSGAAPPRQWRKPVQLMDVVRGAVAEVEQYERIEVRRMPRLSVAGNAVSDLSHLVAELLENATVFSPPHTAVHVQGERVPQGFSLEIHDRGLGMTPAALAVANDTLANSPDFELSDTDRLGLFVVSRLARRHDVRVTLAPSPYGGTTAVVLLSGELLSDAVADDTDHRAPLPDRPSPPALLNGPVDGPVELDAPVSVPGPDEQQEAPPSRRRPEADVPLLPRAAAPVATDVPGVGRHRAPDGVDDPTGEGSEHGAPREDSPLTPLPQRRRTPVLIAENGRRLHQAPGAADEPDLPVTGPVPAAHPADAATDGTTAGLPRRVRQAGLAPQLRHGAPPPSGGWDPAPDADAETVRQRMSSLQRGWERGREEMDSRSRENPPGTDGREGRQP
ncbi:nitrate- and nitrite sensing domain-containing protein [Streptomyces spiramenti]|uniref:histidine kinase n=1 Tax=Streptomyces spiramenti TaxID=2720606 RepID=A0ABX1AMC3_9ACTN|nr:nitrate- and nitrite sensing domain-containing protein [Streptomyces spiramenti]NJP68259.1 histidine kinase [Streptomyces spiramenti]